jgi:hypothetical protein
MLSTTIAVYLYNNKKKKPTIAVNVLPSKLKYCPLTTFVLNIEVNVANYFLSNLLQQKTRIATDNCELNSLYKFLLAGYKLNLHL